MSKMGGILGGGLGNGSGVAPTGFDGEDETEEQPNVSPEEQAQYDRFVENGMSVLYTEDGQVQPEVMQRLATGAGNKPMEALSQTAVWLTMMLEQDAERNGMHVEDDVLLHGGRELFEQLADISTAAEIHDFNEAELQGAWYNALDMYREANSDEGGRFDPDVASAEFAALNEADMEGRADELLPGFEQMSERAIIMAQGDQNAVEGEDDEEE